MARYTPVTLSQNGRMQTAEGDAAAAQGVVQNALQSGVALGQAVRDEHGREGVRAYVGALNPLLPRALIEQLSAKLGVEAPPMLPPNLQHPSHIQQEAQPIKPLQKDAPAIPPELMMQLLQSLVGGGMGGGGLDPAMLLKLLQNR